MDGHSLDHTVAAAEEMPAADPRRARHRTAIATLRTLFKLAQPQSVIDIGCGDGAWLQAALDLEVPIAIGIDSHATGAAGPATSFLAADPRAPGFAAGVAALRHGEPCDLVLCLGTAEHVPPDRSADFVAELCSLGDMVLFAAALPFQARPKPANPQWAEVWAQHFRDAGFRCFDVLRSALWADPSVDWHIAQNLLVFVREGSPAFGGFPALPTKGPLSLVHPQAWLASALQRSHVHREAAQAALASVLQDWVGNAGSGPLLAAPGDDAAAHIVRLQTELDQANTRAEAAGFGVIEAMGEVEKLRREKAAAEAAAADEFKLRMHMENDRLLSDAAEKALHAANDALREHADAALADAARLPGLTAALDRSLEHERVLQKQLADLRDSLEQASADIERLTEQYQEVDERLSVLLGSSSWRLTSPLRATRRMLGGGHVS